MAERKASDLFVECLEAEGVKHVFGIPGEETLDLNESLDGSSIAFVPVRHEQGGAYMADMYGRLTQRAGVCLGTLGPGRDEPRHRRRRRVPGPLAARRAHRPGATSSGCTRSRTSTSTSSPCCRPVTKWNARLNSARRSSRRSCARRSRSRRRRSRARPTSSCPRTSWPRRSTPSRCRSSGRVRSPEPSGRELIARRRGHPRRRSARSCWPATASRAAGAAPALREFARATGIGVAETFMGKGALDYEDPRALGTVGLQSRDYALAGFEDADVVDHRRLRPRGARAGELEPAARQDDRLPSTRRRPRSTRTS